MAIERKPATPVEGTIEQGEEEEISIAIENPESVAIETEDGGVIIDFDPNAPDIMQSSFDSNLAEVIDENELNSLGKELIEAYTGDKESRADWEETYTKGLDQLGLKFED